mgnify:FL=1
MPLWGTAHAATTNKPKFCPNDVNSPYDKTRVYADSSGWVVTGPATGNGNTNADPEILVAIGGLSGATSSLGLKHPTLTNYRIITNDDHGTSNNIVFDVSWDESVTYTAGSAATLLLTATAGDDVTATATHLDGVALTTGLAGNTLRFTATSAQADTYDLAANVTMTDPDLKDTVSGSNIASASKKFTSSVKTAIGYESIVIA